jgi:UDP-GlcNAc:undecaprenyl-phosphate GlcNAc-1-phosphate transferase
MLFEDLGLLFFTVLILSLLFTPLSVAFSFRIGAVDHPVDRSVHSKPMPRLGGLGMVVSILVGMTLFLQFESTVVAFMVGILVISMTGLADDVYKIRPLIKMLGQVIACVLFIEISGLSLTSLGNLLGFGEIVFSNPVSYVVTLFCMVGVINSFNLSDGLDGLAAGVVIIVCFFLGFLGLQADAFLCLTVITVLSGAVLGFLKFNSHPARLFMGDTGSLMLGFSMASISIILVNCASEGIKPISIAIVLAMPIVDTLWVMMRRIVQGKSPMSADKTHLHHRLLALGFSHSVVVTILYAWVIAFGILALLIKNIPEFWQLASVITVTGVFYLLLSLCEYRNISLSSSDPIFGIDRRIGEIDKRIDGIDKIDRRVGGRDRRNRNSLAHFMGLSMKAFPYVVVVGLCLPILMADSLPENLSKLTLGLAFFVAIAFPWKDHHDRLNVVYGLLYLCGFTILYAWNVSSYHDFNIHMYIFVFAGILLSWSLLKVKFKRNSEVFLTSNFELLLIFISWFIPYVVLPAIEVPEPVLNAAKFSCLGAIPLLIVMKLVIKRQPHRNRRMGISLVLILGFIALRAM